MSRDYFDEHPPSGELVLPSEGAVLFCFALRGVYVAGEQAMSRASALAGPAAKRCYYGEHPIVDVSTRPPPRIERVLLRRSYA